MCTHPIITAYSVTAIVFAGYAGTANGAPSGADIAITVQSTAEKHADTPTAPPQVIGIKQLTGTWKIVRLWVDTSGISAWGLDDPEALGSMLTISPESIHWSYPASERFVGMDICTSSAPIISKANMNGREFEEESRASLTAAATYFGISAEQLGPTYSMTCAESDQNSPNDTEARDFTLTQDGRMVIPWYDGAILLLKRQ